MSKGVTEAMVRKLALALPGMEEGTSYGTLAFRVRKKLVARIHGREDALVHYARGQGINAEPLSLVGYEEEGE